MRTDVVLIESYCRAVGGTSLLSVALPLVPVPILLASERQRIRDNIIGAPTSIDIINAKAQGLPGTCLVTYTLKLLCSVTLFKAEYRNHCLLRSTVVVKLVSLPFVLMCQQLGNDKVAYVQGL